MTLRNLNDESDMTLKSWVLLCLKVGCLLLCLSVYIIIINC